MRYQIKHNYVLKIHKSRSISIQYSFKTIRLFFNIIKRLLLYSLEKTLQVYKSIRQLSNSDTVTEFLESEVDEVGIFIFY